MKGEIPLKKSTIFIIIMLAFAFSGLLEIVQSGNFSELTETPVYAPAITGKSIDYEIPPSENGQINLNTAPLHVLDTLDGIGPEYAKRIITHRERTGKFEVIQDIMKVPGIGEKRFLKIKDKISVE